MNLVEQICICLLQHLANAVWKSVIIDQTIMTVFDDLVSRMDAKNSTSNIGVLRDARDTLTKMPANDFVNDAFRVKLAKLIDVLIEILQAKEDALTRSLAERDALTHTHDEIVAELKMRKPVVHLQPTIIEFTLSR